MSRGNDDGTGNEARGSAEVRLHQCTQHDQQEKLEAMVWQANYDLVTIMEM